MEGNAECFYKEATHHACWAPGSPQPLSGWQHNTPGVTLCFWHHSVNYTSIWDFSFVWGCRPLIGCCTIHIIVVMNHWPVISGRHEKCEIKSSSSWLILPSCERWTVEFCTGNVGTVFSEEKHEEHLRSYDLLELVSCPIYSYALMRDYVVLCCICSSSCSWCPANELSAYLNSQLAIGRAH